MAKEVCSRRVRRLFQSVWLVTWFITVAAVAGCGPTNDAVAPVSGRVTVDGKPVKNASVQFTPVGKRGAGGLTDAEGFYRLSTFGQFDGAVLGEHKVAVSFRQPVYVGPPKKKSESHPDPDDPNVISVRPGERIPRTNLSEWKSPVPEKYGNESTSGLSAIVEDKELNEINFDLSSTP